MTLVLDWLSKIDAFQFHFRAKSSAHHACYDNIMEQGRFYGDSFLILKKFLVHYYNAINTCNLHLLHP